jgi:hypothetical protein
MLKSFVHHATVIFRTNDLSARRHRLCRVQKIRYHSLSVIKLCLNEAAKTKM